MTIPRQVGGQETPHYITSPAQDCSPVARTVCSDVASPELCPASVCRPLPRHTHATISWTRTVLAGHLTCKMVALIAMYVRDCEGGEVMVECSPERSV